MLKALFLDMDETLCDTLGANAQAEKKMAASIHSLYGIAHHQLAASAYVRGIYRDWSEQQRERYLPIVQNDTEEAFRLTLIRDLLAQYGVQHPSDTEVVKLQEAFDSDRLAAFNFYPTIEQFLATARKNYTLVVITNGPEFSQVPKVAAIDLHAHVDHVIIGGQEPEQKPARSIFEKALRLANCQADEALHVGDGLATDVLGANNSGIKSVWVRHQQPLASDPALTPHYTIDHPSDLGPLITRLQQASAGALTAR